MQFSYFIEQIHRCKPSGAYIDDMKGHGSEFNKTPSARSHYVRSVCEMSSFSTQSFLKYSDESVSKWYSAMLCMDLLKLETSRS